MNANLLFGCGLGASLLLVGCDADKAGNVASSHKPNIVFIVADDLGYGDLGCYGASAIATPQMDSLAAGGLRFIDAHSVAATGTPSRYSLFTGHYSWRRNDTGITAGDAGMLIRPEQYTMPDMLKLVGYTTGAVGKWHLGLGDKVGTQDWNGLITPGPQDIGFDYSYLMATTGDHVPCVWIENQRVVNYDVNAPISVSYESPFSGEPLGKTHPELLTKLKPAPDSGHNQAITNGISRIGYMKGGGKALWQDANIADTIVAKAVRYIEQHKDTTFFLYVGTNDIHVPRYPHIRFQGKSGMGHRGDAILQLDWTVGEIMKTLKTNGLLENTLVVLTSDNGPVVNDGYADYSVELLGNHQPWGKLRGGKYSSFEAGTRVPFIVSWQGIVTSGISDALVSHIDLFASMAKLAGVSLKDGIAPDSCNQLDALLGVDRKGRCYVIEAARTLSISTGEWKYIEPCAHAPYYKTTRTETGYAPEEQLYNLREDIGEQRNLALEYPEKVKELKALLEREKERGYLLE